MDAWDAVAEAVELLETGELEAATSELQRLVVTDPDNEHAHYFLGNAYFERQQYSKALPCYTRALELVPTHKGAMIAAGHTLRMLGKFDLAIRMGRGVLQVDPRDADALYLLGTATFARGDLAAAATFLQGFLATGPEAEAALEARGMLEAIAEQDRDGSEAAVES